MNKKTKKIYFSYIFVFLFCSCQPKSDLEQALSFAGKNRPELEKVLLYYNQSPEDSLKCKAAEFLICNMPHYYSFANED